MSNKHWLAARSDAKDMAQHFLPQIIEQLLETGEASTDLYNDYADGDSYHHENHTDREYRLLEAAEVLDELSQYEETDNGLWQGLEPREAVGAQAAYTYANAVAAMWQRVVEEINEDGDVGEIIAWEVDPESPGGEEDDTPNVDRTGAPMDSVLAEMLFADGPAADYAQDHGSMYAAQLAAGYRHEAQKAAKALLLREACEAIIKAF